MRTLIAAACLLVPAVTYADPPVQVFAGYPGAYEVHTFQHRTQNFDRAPYFATHPPVYYGEPRLARTYGWTPYPYLGTSYAPRPVTVPADGWATPKPMPEKKSKPKKQSKATKELGA